MYIYIYIYIYVERERERFDHMTPLSVKRTLPLREPWPCSMSAEAALKPRFSDFPKGFLLRRSVFVHRHRYHCLYHVYICIYMFCYLFVCLLYIYIHIRRRGAEHRGRRAEAIICIISFDIFVTDTCVARAVRLQEGKKHCPALLF